MVCFYAFDLLVCQSGFFEPPYELLKFDIILSSILFFACIVAFPSVYRFHYLKKKKKTSKEKNADWWWEAIWLDPLFSSSSYFLGQQATCLAIKAEYQKTWSSSTSSSFIFGWQLLIEKTMEGLVEVTFFRGAIGFFSFDHSTDRSI